MKVVVKIELASSKELIEDKRYMITHTFMILSGYIWRKKID